MPINITSNLQTTNPLIPIVDAAGSARMAGMARTVATLATLTAQVTQERANIDAGFPIWGAEQRIAVATEGGAVRLWTLGADGAGSHARLAELPGGVRITLAGDSNTISATSGAPAAGTGASGDVAFDRAGNAYYAKGASDWVNAGALVSGAFATAVQGAKADTAVQPAALTAAVDAQVAAAAWTKTASMLARGLDRAATSGAVAARAAQAQAVYYDPSASGSSGVGTLANPFTAWAQVKAWAETTRSGELGGYTLNIKRGTVTRGMCTLYGVTGNPDGAPCILAPYGDGAPPEFAGGSVVTAWTDHGDGVLSCASPLNVDCWENSGRLQKKVLASGTEKATLVAAGRGTSGYVAATQRLWIYPQSPASVFEVNDNTHALHIRVKDKATDYCGAIHIYGIHFRLARTAALGIDGHQGVGNNSYGGVVIQGCIAGASGADEVPSGVPSTVGDGILLYGPTGNADGIKARDCVIRDNYLYDCLNNAVEVGAVTRLICEGNESRDIGGNAIIELYTCSDSCHVRYNRSFGSRTHTARLLVGYFSSTGIWIAALLKSGASDTSGTHSNGNRVYCNIMVNPGLRGVRITGAQSGTQIAHNTVIYTDEGTVVGGNALRALLSVVTPARVLLGGLAAGLAAVALAAKAGYDETKAFYKSLALTGNAAGTTLGDVAAKAAAISTSQKAAIGDVRETLQALVSSGRYTGTTLDSAGRAVTALRKLTGQTAGEVVQDFDGMADGVADWAARANRAYNFLSVEQYKQIRALEAQGRSQEAMRVTMDALSQTLETRAAPSIGTIERLWRAAGNALSGFWDKMKALGRDETADDRVARLTKKLADLEKSAETDKGGRRKSTHMAMIADVEAQLAAAQNDVRQARQNAENEGQRALAEQEKIKREQKDFQDAQAQISQAGVQKALAEKQAALDAEAAKVELAHARGLTSERAYSEALGKIEAMRLKNQQAAINARAALVRRQPDATPHDKTRKDAELVQLAAQQAEIQGRIDAQKIQQTAKLDAQALGEARERAQEWARVWHQAADDVRQAAQQNAAQHAQLIVDPVARAAAEAKVQTEELSRQLRLRTAELEVRIVLAPTQEAAMALQVQLADLQRESGKVIGDTDRRAQLASFQQQATEMLERVRLASAAIDQEVAHGTLTALEGERDKRAARDAELEQLARLLKALQALASTSAEKNAVESLGQEITQLMRTTTQAEETLRSSLGDGFATMFKDIATGAATAGDAVRSFISSVASSMLSLIAKDLGQELARSLLPAGAGGGSNWLATASKFVMGLFHSGGVIGARAGGLTRTVAPAVFAAAQVLHTGGLVGGLRANERPVIAEVGEEMLTEDDPRHIKNFRGGPVVGAMNLSVSFDTSNGSAADAAMARGLQQGVRSVVGEYLANEMRPGGLLHSYTNGGR